MRFAQPNEDLTGKVCICSTGRIAVVSGIKEFEFGVCWVGVAFDGKGTWASSNPVVAYESVQEFHDILSKRFGGKMSYLG